MSYHFTVNRGRLSPSCIAGKINNWNFQRPQIMYNVWSHNRIRIFVSPTPFLWESLLYFSLLWFCQHYIVIIGLMKTISFGTTNAFLKKDSMINWINVHFMETRCLYTVAYNKLLTMTTITPIVFLQNKLIPRMRRRSTRANPIPGEVPTWRTHPGSLHTSHVTGMIMWYDARVCMTLINVARAGIVGGGWVRREVVAAECQPAIHSRGQKFASSEYITVLNFLLYFRRQYETSCTTTILRSNNYIGVR